MVATGLGGISHMRIFGIAALCGSMLFANSFVHAEEISSASRFAGAFAALTGGYDAAGDAASGNVYSLLKGSKVGGLAGYNATAGSLLIGLEARGQYSFAKNSTENSYSAPGFSIPTRLEYLQCFGCAQSFLDNYPIPTGYNPLALNYDSHTQIVHSRPWQADLSLRAGFAIQDWLVFGKAGAGAEQSTTVTTNDSTGTKYCDPILVRQRPEFNSVAIVAVGCNSIAVGPKTVTTTTTYNPIALMGLGVERNFDRIFARAEAELVGHFYPGSTYYTPAVNISVGYRF
jgi:opacity protein-like surface antigen